MTTNQSFVSAKAQLTVAPTSQASRATKTGTGPNRSVIVPMTGDAASPTTALRASSPVAKGTDWCRTSWT